ncbi:hypothetical protein EI94DRAFT_1799915 [Lactarius quietus]|nr:hypothetical protein EI94DRAFT_1799915 [Lactarius quietus]
MSLANGMWIGDIPLELKVLTLPERVLVAQFFPAAYIVKLYPKKKGARNWASGLHSALRGNVSTYRLNTDQIAHLTSSHIMPPSSTILAATIGVTFVGPKNFPQKTMPGFLRVNRTRVRVALEWLKENNPLYRNITISAERLEVLPVNDVPEEILSLAKYSDDTRLLAEEMDGYMLSDCADELESDWDESDDDESMEEDETMCWDNVEDAEVVPLQSLGVVDVAANGIKENEVLAHALANVSLSEHAEGWAIKRSSDFVNEYPRRTAEGTLSAGTPDDPNHLLGTFPDLFLYGLGGFEVNCPTPVSYEAHSRWALRYSDKHFREDHFFMFQVFGVLQKRQLCAAASLQISRHSFLRYERAIRTLTPSDFELAGAEERAHKPLSNDTIRSF